jgi:hypothetical protein
MSLLLNCWLRQKGNRHLERAGPTLIVELPLVSSATKPRQAILALTLVSLHR